MDILAVPSSGPRVQDRNGPGKSGGAGGFADLLGSVTGRQTAAETPEPAVRDDADLEETAAAGETQKPVEAERRDRADEAGDQRIENPTDGETARQDRQAATGDPAGTDNRPGSEQAAAEQTNKAGQAPAEGGRTASAGTLAGTAVDQDAARTPAAGTPGVTAAQQAASAAAQALAPTGQQTAAGGTVRGVRLPGQDGKMTGEVRLDGAAAQGPRGALSGNTALAASLAGSTESGGAAPSPDAALAAAAGKPAAGNPADGPLARAFAALNQEAATQPQLKEIAAGSGTAQVLQSASGDEILLPGGAEGVARAQAPGAAAAATPANPAPPSQAPMADQVAVQMHRAVQLGKDRLSIQLHPAELGRVDVKLELGQDGSVRAVLQAERKDTLELLQRDVRGLERALQNAGLQTDGNSISFDLRGGQQQRSGQGFAGMAGMADQGGQQGSSGEDAEPQARPSRGDARHDGAVNIRV